MLTEKQQNVFDVFLHMIEEKQYYLLSSEDRGIGKTYTINELGLTLQALGYRVYIVTHSIFVEHYAERKITDIQSCGGIFTDNSVVLVDEIDFIRIGNLLDYCNYLKIPMVGYANFNVNMPVCNDELFKREYECTWENDH